MALVLLQLSRRINEKRDAGDLHAVQWSALRYFERAGRRAATVIGLSRYLGNTTGSASRTARSLLERGLVTSAPSRTDARSIVFTLTGAGERTLLRDPVNDVAEALGVLSQAELTELAAMLDKVEAALGDARR